MKYIIIIITLSFVVLSCTNTVEKPEKLIDKETMEKILYDLAMLQAIKGHDYKLLPKNNINPKTYIFQKYKIDSIQFANSNKYYSSDILAYKKMYENVIAKVAQEKKALNVTILKEFKADQARKRDSIKRSSKKKKSTIIARG